MSFHPDMTLKMGCAVVLAAAVAGCQAKKQPFADVPAADRQEMSPLVTGPIEPGVAAAQATPPAVSPAVAVPPAVAVAPAVVATRPVAAREPVVPADVKAEVAKTDAEAGQFILRPTDAALRTPTEMTLIIEEGGVLRRAWPVSVCYMPSGDTLAYPHYWNTTDTAMYRGNIANAVLEPVEFFVNSVLLPVWAIIIPPWTPVVYSDEGPAVREHPVIGQPWLEQGK